jgi:hypothetical protein
MGAQYVQNEKRREARRGFWENHPIRKMRDDYRNIVETELKNCADQTQGNKKILSTKYCINP